MDPGLHDGVALPVPDGLWEGSGRMLRHIKVRGDPDIRPDAFAILIRAAWERHRAP